MAILRQKTSFGPGTYRGHKFDQDRLKRFVEGTNKAIAAGVPIPLLKRHAPINASDEVTMGAAQLEGSGWITKVEMEPDGNIAWEAKDVPIDIAQAVQSNTARFTSPEFRDHYVCEKEGVYEGPVIRHFAFTPTPGNPHQGPIEALALSEGGRAIAPELGCFQFAESDRDDESYKAEGDYPAATDDAAKDPVHDTPNDLGAGKEGESIEDETLADDEEWFEDGTGKKTKRKKPTTTAEGQKPAIHETPPDVSDSITQHAEEDDDGFGKPENDEPPLPDMVADTEVIPESPPVNPDMPPVATDKTKLTAVLAGLATKGVVLPSDYDFANPAALDILLAALNSSIKAEQEAEANQEPEQEDPPVQDSAMPFSEAELAALPEKARKALVASQAALVAERKAKQEAEAKAVQFAEQERATRNKVALDTARSNVSKANIPPALRMRLLQDLGEGGKAAAIQFSEGQEQPIYTAQQVADMVSKVIPPSLLYTDSGQFAEVPAPRVSKQIGVDAQGKPVFSNPTSEQFFEHDNTNFGHVDPLRAEEIVSGNQALKQLNRGFNGHATPLASQVAAENQRVPNNVMRG